MVVRLRVEDFDPERERAMEFRENQELQLRKKMAAFITAKGGSVRFDEFMNESLHGEEGYYNQHAEIGPQKDFTTSALKENFAKLIAAHWKSQSLGKDFVEIAGGNGQFKDNFLKDQPEVNYISIEQSDKLVLLQKAKEVKNSKTVQGSALNIPLANNSVEGMIFANELLDALPCRTFRVKVDEGGIVTISDELAVENKDDKIVANFKPVAKDGFVQSYEDFLNSIQNTRRSVSGDMFSVSEDFEKVIKELARVLKRGSIVLPDYGYMDNTPSKGLKRISTEVPFGKDNYRDDVYILERLVHGAADFLRVPYLKDITYDIDFDYLQYLAKKYFPGAGIDCVMQDEFLAKAAKNSNGSLKSEEDQDKVSFYVLEITKE